jgi:hypothetical protein
LRVVWSGAGREAMLDKRREAGSRLKGAAVDKEDGRVRSRPPIHVLLLLVADVVCCVVCTMCVGMVCAGWSEYE